MRMMSEAVAAAAQERPVTTGTLTKVPSTEPPSATAPIAIPAAAAESDATSAGDSTPTPNTPTNGNSTSSSPINAIAPAPAHAIASATLTTATNNAVNAINDSGVAASATTEDGPVIASPAAETQSNTPTPVQNQVQVTVQTSTVTTQVQTQPSCSVQTQVGQSQSQVLVQSQPPVYPVSQSQPRSRAASIAESADQSDPCCHDDKTATAEVQVRRARPFNKIKKMRLQNVIKKTPKKSRKCIDLLIRIVLAKIIDKS